VGLTRDGIGALACLAGSLVLLWSSRDIPQPALVPIGPGFYPRIVLGITAVFALALVLADLWAPKKRSESEKLDYLLVLEMFAVFGLYCGALPYLGFRVCTFLYVAASNALLDWPKGWKGGARVVAVALITTVIVYSVFEHYLTVLLPRGRWTGF